METSSYSCKIVRTHGIRRHVALRHNDEYRDFHGECNAKMLLTHSDDTLVGANKKASVIWKVSGEAKGGCLEISFVAGEVNKGDNLGALCNVVSAGVGTEDGVVKHVTLAIVAEILLSDAAGAAALLLMPMAEDLCAGASAAVVKHCASKNANQGAFSAVNVSNAGDADLNLATEVAASANLHVGSVVGAASFIRVRVWHACKAGGSNGVRGGCWSSSCGCGWQQEVIVPEARWYSTASALREEAARSSARSDCSSALSEEQACPKSSPTRTRASPRRLRAECNACIHAGALHAFEGTQWERCTWYR